MAEQIDLFDFLQDEKEEEKVQSLSDEEVEDLTLSEFNKMLEHSVHISRPTLEEPPAFYAYYGRRRPRKRILDELKERNMIIEESYGVLLNSKDIPLIDLDDLRVEKMNQIDEFLSNDNYYWPTYWRDMESILDMRYNISQHDDLVQLYEEIEDYMIKGIQNKGLDVFYTLQESGELKKNGSLPSGYNAIFSNLFLSLKENEEMVYNHEHLKVLLQETYIYMGMNQHSKLPDLRRVTGSLFHYVSLAMSLNESNEAAFVNILETMNYIHGVESLDYEDHEIYFFNGWDLEDYFSSLSLDDWVAMKEDLERLDRLHSTKRHTKLLDEINMKKYVLALKDKDLEEVNSK